MPSPEPVSQPASVFNTNTTPKEVEIVLTTGQTLIACGMAANNNASLGITVEATGQTFTERQKVSVAENSYVILWSCTVVTGTVKVKFARTSGESQHFGGALQLWTKCSGVGKSAKTNGSGEPSLSLETEKAESAIAMFIADWNAKTGARTYRTATAGAFTEKNYVQDGSEYTIEGGYHANAGAAGAKTIGLTLPTGQKFAMVGIELKGEEAGGAASLIIPPTPSKGLLLR